MWAVLFFIHVFCIKLDRNNLVQFCKFFKAGEKAFQQKVVGRQSRSCQYRNWHPLEGNTAIQDGLVIVVDLDLSAKLCNEDWIKRAIATFHFLFRKKKDAIQIFFAALKKKEKKKRRACLEILEIAFVGFLVGYTAH